MIQSFVRPCSTSSGSRFHFACPSVPVPILLAGRFRFACQFRFRICLPAGFRFWFCLPPVSGFACQFRFPVLLPVRFRLACRFRFPFQFCLPAGFRFCLPVPVPVCLPVPVPVLLAGGIPVLHTDWFPDCIPTGFRIAYQPVSRFAYRTRFPDLLTDWFPGIWPLSSIKTKWPKCS